MKRTPIRVLVLSLLLILGILLSLTGCEPSYRQKRSPLAMRRTVAKIDGQKVPFELVRALFYQYKGAVDGGDDSLWEGEGAKEAWNRVLPMIEDTLKTIYTTFSHAKEVGIDPYSRAVEDRILAYVEQEVAATPIDDKDATGNKRIQLQKEQYYKNLEEQHYTDAASRILYRYSIVSTLLSSYYQDTFADGTLRVTDEAIAAFYASSDCVHLTWARIEKNGIMTNDQLRTLAEQARTRLLACTDYAQIKQILISYSISSNPADIERGMYLSPTTTAGTYAALLEEAADLSHLEIGQIVETYDAFYIPVGLNKEPSALEDKDVRGDVTDLYLEYQLYKSIDTKAAALTVEYTAAFDKYSKAYGSNID